MRPTPPSSKGLVPGSIVADDWYEYINADRRWLESEVERLRELVRKAAAFDDRFAGLADQP